MILTTDGSCPRGTAETFVGKEERSCQRNRDSWGICSTKTECPEPPELIVLSFKGLVVRYPGEELTARSSGRRMGCWGLCCPATAAVPAFSFVES